jgi:uncharacterized protein YbaP (TraB family)
MIPVQELEGAEAQFRMFAAASDNEQYQRLADRLELIESGFENEYHLNVINAWITSDLDRIAAGIEKLVRTRNNYANFYVRDLLDRRNRLFCNKMLSVMTQETGISTFIVGSEHLAGPRGVLALLRGRGAIVRPI